MSLHEKEAEVTFRSLGLGKAPLRLDDERRHQEKAVALGGETAEFPRILIGRSRYEKILDELITSRLRCFTREASVFPEEFLARYFRERYRSTAYDAILQRQHSLSETESSPMSALQRAQLYRRSLVERLLSHVERRRINSRAWLDRTWQELVGPQIAAESQLVRVDRTAGRAILRSVNASLAFSLRRRQDLPTKLSETLGIPIRELRVIA